MRELPRRKDYYSLSTQDTLDEVIGAYKSFFKSKKMGMKQLDRQGFVGKTPSLMCGFKMDMGLKLKGINKFCVLEGAEAMR